MRTIMIAAALGLAGTPAVAQNVDASGGLVDVTVQDVTILNDFLNNAQIQALNNILQGNELVVQVPIGIAANVCNVDVNVIAQSEDRGNYTCEAQNVTRAFANQVVRQNPSLRQVR